MITLPMLTKTALAVALAGTMGVAAVPASFAQDTTKPAAPQAQVKQPGQDMQRVQHWRAHHGRVNPDRGGGPGLLDLITSPRGSEGLDVAFVRLSHRITLTDAQKPLFDDFKTTAMTAQKTYADAVEAAVKAAAPEGQHVDLVTGVKTRLAVDEARLQALNSVMPKLEAFVNSLTDTQKAALTAKRENVGMMGKGEMGKGAMKGGMMAPKAEENTAAPKAAM